MHRWTSVRRGCCLEGGSADRSGFDRLGRQVASSHPVQRRCPMTRWSSRRRRKGIECGVRRGLTCSRMIRSTERRIAARILMFGSNGSHFSDREFEPARISQMGTFLFGGSDAVMPQIVPPIRQPPEFRSVVRLPAGGDSLFGRGSSRSGTSALITGVGAVFASIFCRGPRTCRRRFAAL